MKQDDLEPREFSFGSVLLFGAGCQRFEPNALATVLHAVIDTAADHIRVCPDQRYFGVRSGLL